MTSGAENTCVGSECGEAIDGGSNNTMIGYNCDVAASDRNDTICIGKDITSAAIVGLLLLILELKRMLLMETWV